MADGIRDDTFLHLVDAWWGGEVERRRAAGLGGEDGDVELDEDEDEDIEDGLRAFVDCKGDRFKNSADLAVHVEEWVALYGGSAHPEALRMIEDVLRMWRSIEPKRGSPTKKRRA